MGRRRKCCGAREGRGEERLRRVRGGKERGRIKKGTEWKCEGEVKTGNGSFFFPFLLFLLFVLVRFLVILFVALGVHLFVRLFFLHLLLLLPHSFFLLSLLPPSFTYSCLVVFLYYSFLYFSTSYSSSLSCISSSSSPLSFSTNFHFFSCPLFFLLNNFSFFLVSSLHLIISAFIFFYILPLLLMSPPLPS